MVLDHGRANERKSLVKTSPLGAGVRVPRKAHGLTHRPIVRTLKRMTPRTPRPRPNKDKKIPVRVDAERHAAAHELADHLGYGTVSAMMRAWLYQHLNDFEQIRAASRKPPAPRREKRR